MEEEAENHDTTNGMKQKIQPNNGWKTPVVLRDGGIMAPPNASFFCAACFWQTGSYHKFSLKEYSSHVSVCGNVEDWTKQEVKEQDEAVVVVPLRGNDKMQINHLAAPPPQRERFGPKKNHSVGPHSPGLPPSVVKRSTQKASSHSLSSMPLNGSHLSTAKTAAAAAGKPKAGSGAALVGPSAPILFAPSPDSADSNESCVFDYIFADEPQPSDTSPPLALDTETVTTQATSSDGDDSRKSKDAIKETKRQQRAKRMLAELAPANAMPITTTRWYDAEYEPGLSNVDTTDASTSTNSPVRKSRRKRAPPTKFREPTNTPRTRQQLGYDDFEEMWTMAEESFLERTAEVVEGQNKFRIANKRMNPEDTVHQSSAQYGRILFAASKILLEALDVKKNDTFLDIGHGLANVVLQAAHVIGCASRGIEVVEVRYDASIQFEFALRDAKIAREIQRDVAYGPIGKVDLLCGRLEDPEHLEFMTVPAPVKGQQPGAMKVFFNNFGSVFADKSAKSGDKYYLDHYVAGLFCSMPEGSILISCSRLDLPSTRSKILIQRPDAKETGFYEDGTVDLGSAHMAVSWAGQSNFHRIIGHKYIRVGPPFYICGKCGKRKEAYKTLNGGQRVPNFCCNDNFAGLRPRKEKKKTR